MKRHILLALIAATMGCGGPTPSPATSPTRTTAAAPAATKRHLLQRAPDGLRLPRTVRPLGYRVALDVDPAKETFGGRVVIDVELDQPTHPLWLNATNLTIESARILANGTQSERALEVVVPGDEDIIGLAADEPIGPGKVQVEIAYTGLQNDRQSDGILRKEEAGNRYLVTDLEPLGARRVMPSFDEPGFKVPWQLELTVPAGTFAVANAPIESERQLDDGRRQVRFAATPPMPSYLFAFAVGPYDVVDAGATRKGVPLRILVPRGRGADAAFVAREASRIVASLEEYTGIDFPYAKLDQIVIPGKAGGAMENVGLITYAPSHLLIPASENHDVRRRALSIMAHEIAHQWYGNLVTMTWWDDLWLNEAFADWAADHVMLEFYGTYDRGLSAASSRMIALAGEADPGVRAIRQPIATQSDIQRAFDSITYSKGATVLHMFEQSVGPDVMRAGVRAYLGRHRWGNATAADFLTALSAAAGRDLSPTIAPWLDRAGAPLVSMSLTCAAGQPAIVELAQRRAPVAGPASVADTAIWPLPVCVRVVGESTPRCTELTERTGRIELGDRCPSLVVPTGRGHFHTQLSAPLRSALARHWKRLDEVEQAAVAIDTSALVDVGELDVGAMLDLIPLIGPSENRIAINAAAVAMQRYGNALEPSDRPRFAKLVDRSFRKVARATGWTPRPGEAVLPGVVRRTVVPVVAMFGNDEILRREVRELARRWLKDHDVLARDAWVHVLRAAILADDGTLLQEMLPLVHSDPDVLARRAMAAALGRTTDPTRLRRVLEAVTAPPTIAPETLPAFWGPDLPALTEVRLAFLEQHLPQLLEKVPLDWRSGLMPWTCRAQHRDRVAAMIDAHFVSLRDVGPSGRDRELARVDACIAETAILRNGLKAYLGSR